MKRRIFTFENGETFEEPADWTEFVRRALFGLAIYPSFGVNTHYDYDGVDRRFPDLYKALAGTGAEHDFADGVLRVMETGTSPERYEARLGPYPLAPDARKRIERLLVAGRDALIVAKVFNVVLSRLFEMPGTPEVATAILRRELADSTSEDLADVAMERDYDWFVTHLPPYRDALQPDRWLYFEEDDRAQELLDVMMQRTDGYVERLRMDLTNPALAEDFRAYLAAQLAAHPVGKRLLEQ